MLANCREITATSFPFNGVRENREKKLGTKLRPKTLISIGKRCQIQVANE